MAISTVVPRFSLIQFVAYYSYQGLPILTVGTSMAVTITHVFLWGSSATNHIVNALMGSLHTTFLVIKLYHIQLSLCNVLV
jgi:hypothetical protein